jgi:alkylation response protein AidB-like acyl-CoA dehydrogenase
MADPVAQRSGPPPAGPAALRTGVVLRVTEEVCEVLVAGGHCSAGFAASFPSPRTERVAPGHLVALAPTSRGTEAVVWRWYDAVVLGEEAGRVRLWEPAHGEVLAQPRSTGVRPEPGTRAYLSAGLPGAEWWVAGAAHGGAAEPEVELGEVARFWTEHDLWPGLG